MLYPQKNNTTTLGTRFTRLYRPLLRNLLIIVLLTLAATAAVLVYFDARLVNNLSRRLIQNSTQATIERLQAQFETTNDGLSIAIRQIADATLATADRRNALYQTLVPFLSEIEFLDSINVADSNGNEFVLIKQEEEILTRDAGADTSGKARWQRYVDGVAVEQWERQRGVAPNDRPWFQGAMKTLPGEHFWTPPYSFQTSKQPGVSVSTRWPQQTGTAEIVMAFNVTLTEISRYTSSIRPSDNGMTVIFGPKGKTIGLPVDFHEAEEEDLSSAVLSPVSDLGIPAINSAMGHWQGIGRLEGIFDYHTGDGAAWRAGFAKIPLNEQYAVWSAVLVPEADFSGSLARVRNLLLAGIGLTGFLVATIVAARAMRRIRRQMQTVVDQLERNLGQYHLKRKIGEGGNGTVYCAQHALLRRPTAIKLMNAEFASSEAARHRFEHEVQVASSLSHPNTIAIYDYGQTPDGTLYYAMELLQGGTLEQLIAATGPLPSGRVIHILAQIAGSLAEAHDKGLIHRDIKPSNAILCERGGLYDVIKVLDFGLVKEMGRTDGNLTQANILIGTPLYMAPELITQAGQSSVQSDLYALGAVGYYLLTARNVFEGGSAVEICAKHLNDPPVAPSMRIGRAVAQDLETLLLHCLAKKPADRPENAEWLRNALLACEDAASWTQQHARAWWRTYSSAFAASLSSSDAVPMSNTEMLVDFDRRESTSGEIRDIG